MLTQSVGHVVEDETLVVGAKNPDCRAVQPKNHTVVVLRACDVLHFRPSMFDLI